MGQLRWLRWLRQALHFNSRRRWRSLRPHVMVLEDRWLLSLTLQSVSGFASYAGVGFQENAVARLQGDSTNITDYHAQIDWGDSNQRVAADLASANPSSGFL